MIIGRGKPPVEPTVKKREVRLSGYPQKVVGKDVIHSGDHAFLIGPDDLPTNPFWVGRVVPSQGIEYWNVPKQGYTLATTGTRLLVWCPGGEGHKD